MAAVPVPASVASAPVPVPVPVVRLAGGPGVPAGAAPIVTALQPAIAACDSAISYRVREGTRAPGGGLLTALVDAVEVAQTTLDLARRTSPLLPAALELCTQAFVRAEDACHARGDGALEACARVLAQTRERLVASTAPAA